MNSTNLQVISGFVGGDLDFKFTQGGTAVANFNVAVSSSWKDKTTQEWKDKTTWVRVNIWGAYAESLKDKIKKGMYVMVTGSMEAPDAWIDKNGQAASRANIRAEQITWDYKKNGNGNGNGHDSNNGQAELDRVMPSGAPAGTGDDEFNF